MTAMMLDRAAAGEGMAPSAMRMLADSKRDPRPREVHDEVRLKFTGGYRVEAKSGGEEDMYFEVEGGKEIAFDRYSYSGKELRRLLDSGNRELTVNRTAVIGPAGMMFCSYELPPAQPAPTTEEHTPVESFHAAMRSASSAAGKSENSDS